MHRTLRFFPLVLLLLPLLAAPARAGIELVDVAASVGLVFTPTPGAAFDEIEPPMLQMMQRIMGTGAAVGDVDGDGDLDVYLLGHRGQANRLFRNDLDLVAGTRGFTDVTPAVLADTGISRVALFADFDNDGDPDLLLVNDRDAAGTISTSRVFRNDGGGIWNDVTAASGFAPAGFIKGGASVADYDGDGLLDVYVSNWSAELGTGSPVFPGSNQLYRNLGGLVFQDVTATQMLGGLSRDSFASIFTDFDGDHRPDLYVAIDHTSDAFYWNTPPFFVPATLAVNTTHIGNDMGVAAADYDNDGDLDLYATNITHPTGAFGTTQGNVFYEQQPILGVPYFVDRAAALGVDDTYWGWGTVFADLENDGDLDLVAVTGFDEFLFANDGGAASPLYQTPGVLFENGPGGFARTLGTDLDLPDDSRALIAFDYDRDGDTDLLVTNHDQPVRLLENQSTGQGHWLTVRLGPDAMAAGAYVEATVGGVTLRRDAILARSYLSGFPPEVHFGLGAATQVDTLRIVWADGSEETRVDVAADQVLDVTCPPCRDGIDNDGDGLVDLDDPTCRDSNWVSEYSACSDGIDNDLDGGTDWDGAGTGVPDPTCGQPWDVRESSGCGLGAEVAALLPLLQAARLRRRRAAERR